MNKSCRKPLFSKQLNTAIWPIDITFTVLHGDGMCTHNIEDDEIDWTLRGTRTGVTIMVELDMEANRREWWFLYCSTSRIISWVHNLMTLHWTRQTSTWWSSSLSCPFSRHSWHIRAVPCPQSLHLNGASYTEHILHLYHGNQIHCDAEVHQGLSHEERPSWEALTMIAVLENKVSLRLQAYLIC